MSRSRATSSAGLPARWSRLKPARPAPTVWATQDRGTLFIAPGAEVYAGMIVGQCNRNEDMSVNVCKKKQLTNMRAAGSDEAIRLAPPKILSLEQCMEYLADDELLEVTPKSLRMRKRISTTRHVCAPPPRQKHKS